MEAHQLQLQLLACQQKAHCSIIGKVIGGLHEEVARLATSASSSTIFSD